MPHFAVHALDKPSALKLRLEHSAAHRAYVETAELHNVHVLVSGPLQSDDGEAMIGSLFIIEAEDGAKVRQFAQADPFATAGVWESVAVSRFHKRKG